MPEVQTPAARGWRAVLLCARAPCVAMVLLGATLGPTVAESPHEPPLPAGLGEESPDEPTLPSGLEGDEPDAPALPPGLGDEKRQDEGAEAAQRTLADRLPAGVHGFAETRLGPRIHRDPAQSSRFTMGEVRLQGAYARAWKPLSLEAKGDLIFDGVLDSVETDLRVLRLSFRPLRSVDLQLGRQIITWGTGDLLFINDLFPKDWQSFFIGRDEEYLKAPSDAVRAGWFGSKISLDLVYTPTFDPDRYIRGERISFFDPQTGEARGDDAPLRTDRPDEPFDDDEIALRVYGRVGPWEITGYGYDGFWKSPAGFDPLSGRGTFPALSVLGAGARGPLGPGIVSVETGYYDSRSDRDGSDPLIANGELRLLVGYEMELARELTGGFQYYLEHMLDHDAYLENLPAGEPRDENRHVLTVRLTRLLRSQTVTASLFVYYSPSDRDGYVRPRLTYALNDAWILEGGANLFFGDEDHTFFGQFDKGSNVYGAVRFSF